MHPFLLFLLAIVSPLLLAVSLLVPLYAGIAAAAYFIYSGGNGPHPLAGQFDSPFYMIDVYSNLFHQWTGHIAQSDLLTYSAPLIGMPLLGAAIALWLTAKLARKLKDIFQLGASV